MKKPEDIKTSAHVMHIEDSYNSLLENDDDKIPQFNDDDANLQSSKPHNSPNEEKGGEENLSNTPNIEEEILEEKDIENKNSKNMLNDLEVAKLKKESEINNKLPDWIIFQAKALFHNRYHRFHYQQETLIHQLEPSSIVSQQPQPKRQRACLEILVLKR